MKVAISGAGIAGTTLAHWLLRAGHEPILIERAPAFRTGGYVMDFWGVGYTVAERMEILSSVRRVGYQVQEVRFVADDGHKSGGFSADTLSNLTGGRMTSVARGDLAGEIYRTIEDRIETNFDDQVVSIEERSAGIRLTLESGKQYDTDILVGADGLHSQIRQLKFGPEEEFEKDLGYRFAVFQARDYAPRNENIYTMHSTPSRQIARFALRDGRTLLLLVFRRDLLKGVEPRDESQARTVLKAIFADSGWEAQQILAAMDYTDDFYYDRVSQIRMPVWHEGRVVLLGDAGAAVSFLAGEGAGLAMTHAYVLAGELMRSPSDHLRAFASYEAMLRPFMEAKQKTAENFASTFVPKSEFGIWLRNQATKLMVLPGVAKLMLGESLSDDFELPDYAYPPAMIHTKIR